MKKSITFLRLFFKSMGYLAPIWGFLLLVMVGLGALVARLEELPYGDGFYFAWVTAFTVGYGDIVPTGALSRFASLLIGLTGLIFTGLWVAVAVNSLKFLLGEEQFLSKEKLNEMKASFTSSEKRSDK
ncbi:potassium channel family protein [Kiritimatiellota bacterium B12222]|nr:potassium channel family protein [Kiritimatiellota bacterium B12222]